MSDAPAPAPAAATPESPSPAQGNDFETAFKLLEFADGVRRFEIEKLWQRALFFGGMQTVVFAGLEAVKGTETGAANGTPGAAFLATPLMIFGLISALAWTLVNRGSKYWQERWEHASRSAMQAVDCAAAQGSAGKTGAAAKDIPDATSAILAALGGEPSCTSSTGRSLENRISSVACGKKACWLSRAWRFCFPIWGNRRCSPSGALTAISDVTFASWIWVVVCDTFQSKNPATSCCRDSLDWYWPPLVAGVAFLYILSSSVRCSTRQKMASRPRAGCTKATGVSATRPAVPDLEP